MLASTPVLVLSLLSFAALPVRPAPLPAAPATSPSSNTTDPSPSTLNNLRILAAYSAQHFAAASSACALPDNSTSAAPPEDTLSASGVTVHFAPSSAADGNGESDVDSVEEVFLRLKSKVDKILPIIDNIVASGQASALTLSGPIAELNAALLETASSMAALHASAGANGVSVQLSKRGLLSQDDVAKLVAGIVGQVTTTLHTLTGLLGGLPIVGPLLSGLDAALATTLSSLTPMLGTVLGTVGSLLSPVGGLLNSLGLGLVASLLGL